MKGRKWEVPSYEAIKRTFGFASEIDRRKEIAELHKELGFTL